ncbi:MAG: hypothetical protein WC241_00695 [Candidatus Paceibacterota bacterium]|jgi:hypothetical protein
MNNFLIKKITKAINNFFKINPHKHWMVLLYIFLISILILISISLYLLYEIKNEQIFQVTIEKDNTQTLLKEDLLKKTTETYNTKAKRLIEMKNNFSSYNDPSL